MFTTGTKIPKTMTDAGPAIPKDMETAILKLIQQSTATTMRPMVEHVDQLFQAVESLGTDLAEQQVRTRGQHMDKTFAQRLDEVEHRQRGLETELSQSFAGAVESKLEEQSARFTALVGDLRNELCRELLPLLVESKGPLARLFEQQEDLRTLLRRIEERLDASVGECKTTADAMRRQLQAKTEQLDVDVCALREAVGYLQTATLMNEQFDSIGGNYARAGGVSRLSSGSRLDKIEAVDTIVNSPHANPKQQVRGIPKFVDVGLVRGPASEEPQRKALEFSPPEAPVSPRCARGKVLEFQSPEAPISPRCVHAARGFPASMHCNTVRGHVCMV